MHSITLTHYLLTHSFMNDTFNTFLLLVIFASEHPQRLIDRDQSQHIDIYMCVCVCVFTTLRTFLIAVTANAND